MRRFFYTANAHNVITGVDNKTDANYPKLSTFDSGDVIELPESITQHWCRVLRASINDKALIFDGFGGEYQVKLQSSSKKHATATLLSYHSDDRSASVITKIGLVMSRGERMDYAIQKSTELGVTAIQLLSSHHGEVTLKPAQIDKKLAHWQQIAIAACEQCGLNRVPLILAPKSITQWLDEIASGESVDSSNTTISLMQVSPVVAAISQDAYYHSLNQTADLRLQLSVPAADQPMRPTALAKVLTQSRPYLELLIGPEGGLSSNEITQASSAGFLPWQLGMRVLRTETAPVVALATLQALLN